MEEARAKIEAMAGPNGLMLFGKTDHGLLLLVVGLKQKSLQYVVGNPLIAVQMTQHDIRASLYAPLRVLLYVMKKERLAWNTTGQSHSSASSQMKISTQSPRCLIEN